jgi:hypothetical protein
VKPAKRPPEVPPAPVPPVPPVPPLSSLLAQEIANIAKTPHMAREKLDLTIVLLLAFMSPSRLVFTYSIAEAIEVGKTYLN